MANLCDNKFYLKEYEDSIEDFEKSKESILNYIHNYVTGYITYSEGGVLEGYFISKWTFPRKDFEKLLKGNIYFRCLSEEYGCGYVAMNIFEEGNWREEQTLDV